MSVREKYFRLSLDVAERGSLAGLGLFFQVADHILGGCSGEVVAWLRTLAEEG